MNEDLKALVLAGPVINEAYDASTQAAHVYFNQVKGAILNSDSSISDLEQQSKEEFGNEALAFRTMLKFIRSLEIIEALKEPVLVTLINPVYKERGRMSRREEHPHGENSLRNKIETLNFFNTVNPLFEGRIFVIDDECPENSGRMAEEILSEYPGKDNRVYYLGDALAKNDPQLPPGLTVKSGANRSVKGGSVLFGMRKALEEEVHNRHIIVDNDADLSVHPMQLGLIIDDIIRGEVDVVAGSRREIDSVALIGGERNRRGELFINIWQTLLPQLGLVINDTNRAFKAFDSKALRRIIEEIKIYTFPYQIELLQATLSNNLRLKKRGIAYIDSEAASTQSGANITETYLNQIHQIIDIATRYKAIEPHNPLVNYFKWITEEEWLKIEANPPANLEVLF